MSKKVNKKDQSGFVLISFVVVLTITLLIDVAITNSSHNTNTNDQQSHEKR